MSTHERKLASIQRIQEVKPIPGADAIEAYRVLGWWVVGKKNEFEVGDYVVYIEIDSWVPHELAPFLSKGKDPREYNGVYGERLKTAKLRGQLSQGLILSTDIVDFALEGYLEGYDLTEYLNIQKWEAPIPANLAGQIRGLFPTNLVPKTAQERVQNCFEDVLARDDQYEVTIKLDGTSMTVFWHEGELRVCSRNLDLKFSEDNLLWQTALKIKDRLLPGYAYQGELMGPSIQNNREQFKEHKFFVFDIVDLETRKYLDARARQELCIKLDLDHVPILACNASKPASVEQALALAEGESINHKTREGIVFKSIIDPEFSFKVISNQYLLKEK